MRKETVLDRVVLREEAKCPFVTIIGRMGAGVPIDKIEYILEFDNEAAKKLFQESLENKTFVKVLLDESRIKSLVILDNGEVYPSTFHYETLKKRCQKYIPIITTIGCDKGGINMNKVSMCASLKNFSYSEFKDILAERDNYTFVNALEYINEAKCLLVAHSDNIYPSTFNYKTIKKRLNKIVGAADDEEDEVMSEE